MTYSIYRYDSDTESNNWVIMPPQSFEDARKSAVLAIKHEAETLERVLLVETDAPTEAPYYAVGMIIQSDKNHDDTRLITYSLRKEH